jgi:kumamolisin
MAKKSARPSSTRLRVPRNYQRLAGSVRHRPVGARLVGLARPAEKLSITVRVRRPPKAPPLPDARHWMRVAVSERSYLTRAEFSARYGATRRDLEKVVAFAQSHGLTVRDVSAPRRSVMLSGRVQDFEHAFAVKLNAYRNSGETFRGREGPIHIPRSLRGIITGVFGLDNRSMARRAYTPAGAAPLTPMQVAQLYEFPIFLDGMGQSIAVLEFGGGFVIDSMTGRAPDLDATFQALGRTTPDVAVGPPVDGVTNSPIGGGANDDVETVLDITVAGCIAPRARIIAYFAPWTEQGWVDALTTIANDTINAPSILSISWGWAEGFGAEGFSLTWTAMAMQHVSETLQEAAAMRLTVFISSGDDGTTCNIDDGRAHVSYPASDPWVTGCGGTIITNVSGNSFEEQTWKDKRLSLDG